SPPNSPGWLSVLGITYNSVTLRWTDASTNESGFIVYMRETGDWQVADSIPANRIETTVPGLQSGRIYFFRLTSYNSGGESAPTNSAEAHTPIVNPPNPPTDVTANPISEFVVHVTWTDRGTQDSFLIQRRVPQGDWQQVGSTPDNVQSFYDSTTVALTLYYYRVGATSAYGLSWSDSTETTTPPPGAPASPESLRVQTVIGVGVILTWLDRSIGETRFEIGRNLAGDFPTVIDSVDADVTAYTDSLGSEVGHYFYRVRSANAHGVSTWTLPIEADYRFCSSGLIPICVGNVWEYRVDTTGGAYWMRRRVLSVDYPNGLDFYLWGQAPVTGGRTDTLYYLRNFTDVGCHIINYPLSENPLSQVLFRYPVAAAGVFYWVDGDCVLVLSTGMSLTVQGEVYSGVYVYQRFFDPLHTIQYYIKPNTVGIIQEDEWTGPVNNPVLAARRQLTYREIYN
ncbi:fibronectin type III domain-containing protein, partial [candidate division KSB1 bacterium]